MARSEVWGSGVGWVVEVVDGPGTEEDGRGLVEGVGVGWRVEGAGGGDEDAGITGFDVEIVATGACTWGAVKLSSSVVNGVVEYGFRLLLDVVVVVESTDVSRAAFWSNR